MKLPVYSRADLSRTVELVVALFLTAVSTSAVAREFRAADTQSEDYPTVQALRYMGRMIAEKSCGRGHTALAASHAAVGIHVRHAQAPGAEPIELPYGQVLTGLATRLIDGAENNWPSYVTTDHYKDGGYYALAGHTMSPEVLVMAQKSGTGIYARALRASAAAELIERIRKVE
jgi:TRAP-type C4-dicarboxylate transport system substrate-binding protein